MLKRYVPGLKVVNISRQLQALESSFCGYHTLGFLLSQDERIRESLSKYMRRFNRRPVKENDTIVVNHIISFIQKFGTNE